jgi:cation:H+ antiporter
MLLDVIWLVTGLALIVKGGDFFVAASIRIAEFLKMPRVVVGSTLVSLATTTPEVVVSIMSGFKGASDLAVGNAVGSCICNIGLILGVMAAIKQVEVHPRMLRMPLIAMFVCGAALLTFTLDLVLSRWQGAFLLALGAGYFVWDFWKHYRERKPAVITEAVAIKREVTATRWSWFTTKPGTAVQFALGAVILILGSKLVVEGAVNLAGRMGVPPIAIGLTVVAVGTSLPELITAITSSRKAVADLAVGNVLGANIANLTLVVGVAAIIHDVSMDRLTQVFNFPAMLVVMSLLLWILLTDRRVTRREGVVLLSTYAIYIAALVTLTLVAGR